MQIRSTHLRPRLPSPTMLIFNHPIRSIMLVMNSSLINADNAHSEALVKNKDHVSIPIGSTIVAQQGDRGPWTCGTITGKGDRNHHDRPYKV